MKSLFCWIDLFLKPVCSECVSVSGLSFDRDHHYSLNLIIIQRCSLCSMFYDVCCTITRYTPVLDQLKRALWSLSNDTSAESLWSPAPKKEAQELDRFCRLWSSFFCASIQVSIHLQVRVCWIDFFRRINTFFCFSQQSSLFIHSLIQHKVSLNDTLASKLANTSSLA